MILADTNIISTFARVGALPLVRRLLEVEHLHIVPATYNELRKALEVGCAFLDPVLAGIASGGDLDLVELSRKEVLAVKDLPRTLGAGEAESISVCLHRPGMRLLTNDKRARNFSRERGIRCLDLADVLRALCVRKVLSKKKVTELIRQIETEQGMIIKNKEQILA